MPNHAIVPVAPDGTVCIAAGVHAADVIVDVDGWFSFAAGLQPGVAAAGPRHPLGRRSHDRRGRAPPCPPAPGPPS